MGGNEILNSARAYGYTQTVDCPIDWFRIDPCDGLRQALDDELYTVENITQAPWYDPRNEATTRFFGAYGLSLENLSDSTRTAEVVEGILDGGTVGKVRRAVRQVRVRAVLVAQGEDALEAGMTWLKAALDPSECGIHGNSCGQADVCFYTACPPSRSYTPGFTPWMDVATNRAISQAMRTAVTGGTGSTTIGGATPPWTTTFTNIANNPSFETANGTTELRRNSATHPVGVLAAATAGQLGLYNTRFFGNGGAGTYTLASAATDGPPGGPTTYLTKRWTTANTATNANSGLDLTVQPSTGVQTTGFPVVAGTQLTISAWVRIQSLAKPVGYQLYFHNAAGAFLSQVDAPTVSVGTGGATGWQRLSYTFTPPATAAFVEIVLDVDTGANFWGVNDTYSATGVLLEAASTAGIYFDGTVRPRQRVNIVTNPRLALGSSGWSFNQTWTVAPARVAITDLPGFDWAWAAEHTGATATGQQLRVNVTIQAPGEYRAGIWAKVTSGTGVPLICVAADSAMNTRLAEVNAIADGQWHWYALSYTTTGGTNYFGVRFSASQGNPATAALTGAIIQPGAGAPLEPANFFDGATTASGYGYGWSNSPNLSWSYEYDADLTTAWTGTANASASRLTAAYPAGFTSQPANQAITYLSSYTPAVGTRTARSLIQTTTAVGLPVTSVLPTTDEKYTLLLRVRPMDRDLTAQLRIRATTILSDPVVFPKGVWTEARWTAAAGSGDSTQTGLILPAGGGHQVGDRVDVDAVVLATGEYAGGYFDGGHLPAGVDPTSTQVLWTGTADASASALQVRESGDPLPMGDSRITATSTITASDAFSWYPGVATGAATNLLPASPGVVVRASAEWKATRARRVKWRVGFYDAAQTLIGTVQEQLSAAAAGDGVWNIATGIQSTAAPAGTAYVLVELTTGDAGVDPVGFVPADWVETRRVMVTFDQALPRWFDGNTPDTELTNYFWTGTAYASTSVYQTRTLDALIPEPDDEYDARAERYLRKLHGVTAISGPLVEQKLHRGEVYGYIVEFTLAAETPWLWSETRTISSPPAVPVVVQDIVYNLAPYPSAELPGTAMVAATNYATNPSVETNATGWNASSTVITPAPTGARSTELSAVGTASYKASVTATNTGSNGTLLIYQDVPITSAPAGSRFSANLWASAQVTSGTAVLGPIEIKVDWLAAGLTYISTTVIGTEPAAGGALTKASMPPPATATIARVQATVTLTSWSTGAVIALFADALSVTVP